MADQPAANPPPPRWPWDDRGRSLLTRDKIAEQSAEALRLFRQSFPHAYANRTG